MSFARHFFRGLHVLKRPDNSPKENQLLNDESALKEFTRVSKIDCPIINEQ